MHDPDAVPGNGDDALEEAEFDAVRGRIAGEVPAPASSASPDSRIAFCSSSKKSTPAPSARADVGTSDHETVRVDRIGRIRHQHRIARPHRRQRQMRQALLEPIVTMASLSASSSTSKRRLYQLQIARRRRGMPFETE